MMEELSKLISPDCLGAVLRAVAIVLVGLVAARFAGRAMARLVSRRGDGQPVQLVRRLTAWGVFLMSLAWAMQELGFQLGVLLGAAGVVTVAIGFASQTSLSNLISGFFLFGERPFRVGDIVEVENTTGVVLAIDLFSTKLRTYTNDYVRIPNEIMFKTKLTNMTRFPVRRLDILVPVSYEEDLDRVRSIAFAVADQSAVCLSEPAPLFFVASFGESAVQVQVSVWCQTPEYLALKSSYPPELKAALDREGVRIPYPHRVLHQSAAPSEGIA